MIPQDTGPKPRDDVDDESMRMGDLRTTGKPDISSPVQWRPFSPDNDNDNVFVSINTPVLEVGLHRLNSTVNITEVAWNTVYLSKDRDWDATSLSSATDSSFNATRGVQNFVFDNGNNLGSVSLSLLSQEVQQAYGTNMSVAIHWITNFAHGVTHSELFTVVGSEEAAENINQDIWEEFSDGWEEITPNTPPASQTRTASIPSGTAGVETGSNVGAGSDVGTASDDGLSTGAIAGIAVGSAIGFLLLITGLVWFFLLRRRRRPEPQEKALVQDDPQLDTTGAYAMNKEMSRVTDSPQTPRSNFPGNDTNMSSWPLTEQVGRALEERALTPSASRQDLTRSGAGTPSGLHPNVAHLVEDGMTEDEIRRLEEEERQLDDEIERARRRR